MHKRETYGTLAEVMEASRKSLLHEYSKKCVKHFFAAIFPRQYKESPFCWNQRPKTCGISARLERSIMLVKHFGGFVPHLGLE